MITAGNGRSKMEFKIKHKCTGSVIFTADIGCKRNEYYSIKLGLAVKVAVKADANLAGANLTRANLAEAKELSASITCKDQQHSRSLNLIIVTI